MGVVEPNKDKAREWMDQWLGAGHEVSAAARACEPFTHGRFRTYVSNDATPERIAKFEEGDMAGRQETDEWLAGTLDELTGNSASCVIVEEDLARPNDPSIVRGEIPAAFIGDRVVSWSDLTPRRGAEVVTAIRRVASGYPRNAFVVSRSAGDLGLADRQHVPEDFPSRAAKSLLAVIVSIFDDESYLVWDRGERPGVSMRRCDPDCRDTR